MVAINSQLLNAPLDWNAISGSILQGLTTDAKKEQMQMALQSMLQPQTANTNVVSTDFLTGNNQQLISNLPQDLGAYDTRQQDFYTPMPNLPKKPLSLDELLNMEIAKQDAQRQQTNTQASPTTQKSNVAQPSVATTETTTPQGVDFWKAIQDAMGRFAEQNLYSQKDTGETSMLQDIIRSQAAVYAPQYSAILESDIKGKKDTATLIKKAEQDALTKQQERVIKLQDDMSMAIFKQELENQKNEGKIDDKDAGIIQKQINDFKSDKMTLKARTSVESASVIREVLNSQNPIGDTAVKILMPRMLGEVGNLTKAEQDVYGGSAAVTKRINQAFKSMVNGKLTNENREFLLDLVDKLESSSSENLIKIAEQYKSSLKSLRPKLDATIIDSSFSPFLGNIQQSVNPIIQKLIDSGASLEEITIVKKELGI